MSRFGHPRIKLENSLDTLKFIGRNSVTEAVAKMLTMTRDELLEATKRSEATIAEVMVGSIIVKAIEESDHAKMNTLLSYIAAKPHNKKKRDNSVD